MSEIGYKAEGGVAQNFVRRAPTLSGLALLTFRFQTLGAQHLLSQPLVGLTKSFIGIIYSDIGTSPLYVLNGIWPPSGPVPSEEDVIGGLSAIIRSITLLPLVKYVLIVQFSH